MDQQKQQLVKRLQDANNILVTVSSSPSVDQLSAAIGLTILLNKLKKHATAVYSGATPSTIEFLKPEETLERNTDSLRDFIISLDKSKADKLRYKVDNDANVVRIFITPYKTSINQDDLDFSQGDFNVDVVVAIGVNEQQDLDQAITAHGRILHDATVTTINTHTGGELGSINYIDPAASSLSELTTDVADMLGRDLIDGQIATALLTGIVAETDRFSNERTTPETMRLSAALMTAGANQQLVATSLEAAMRPAITGNASDSHDESGQSSNAAQPDDGTLEITHQPGEERHDVPEPEVEDEPRDRYQDEPQSAMQPEPQAELPHIGDVKQTNFGEGPNASDGIALLPPSQSASPHYMTEPPRAGGMLTANTQEEDLVEEARDPFGILLPEEPNANQPPLNNKPPLTLPTNPELAAAPEEPEEPKQPWTPRTLPVTVVTPEPKPEPIPAPAPMSTPAPAVAPTPPPAPVIAPAPVSVPRPVASAAPVPDLSLPPVANTTPGLAAPPIQFAPPDTAGNTLSDLEQAVHSPHASVSAIPATSPAEHLDAARDAVMNAINSAPQDPNAALPPKADIGASGYLNVQDLPGMSSPTVPTPPATPAPSAPIDVAPVAASPADRPLDMPLPPASNAMPVSSTMPSPLAPTNSGLTPPPVPPPMTELPPL